MPFFPLTCFARGPWETHILKHCDMVTDGSVLATCECSDTHTDTQTESSIEAAAHCLKIAILARIVPYLLWWSGAPCTCHFENQHPPQPATFHHYSVTVSYTLLRTHCPTIEWWHCGPRILVAWGGWHPPGGNLNKSFGTKQVLAWMWCLYSTTGWPKKTGCFKWASRPLL